MLDYEEKKVVITYGTFDLFHVGHLNLLERLKQLGDILIVGVSTDEFNQAKGKESFISFHDRARIISSLKCVDLVIPEESWDQKIDDVKNYNVDIFGIGDDWSGKFDFLNKNCKVLYLKRSHGISSTSLRSKFDIFLNSKYDGEVLDMIEKLRTGLS